MANEKDTSNPTRVITPFHDPELIVLRNPVAKARFNLSVYQTKFLLEVLSYLKSRPDERILEFNIRQFNRNLSVDNNDIRYYVNEIRKMVSHVVSIPTEERTDGGIKLKEVALISGIDTDIDGKGEGYIRVEVAEMIKPYFLEIANGQFFSFHKYNSHVLKGKHTISLYLMLKSYQRLRKMTIGYNELRDILEIKPNEYQPFKEFKRWILERSRNEMLEKNDIYFDFEVVRVSSSSRSDVEKIVFTILDNPNKREMVKQIKSVEKGDKSTVFSIAKSKTGENSEAKKNKSGENSELKEDTKREKIRKPEIATQNTPPQYFSEKKASENSLNAEIEKHFRFFDLDTPKEVIDIFVDGLKANGFIEERILDVLLFAQEQTQKGEKIRNLMGYMKTGLESGIMGRGMWKAKSDSKRLSAEDIEITAWRESPQFAAYLRQFYIDLGLNADNDRKRDFTDRIRSQHWSRHLFDENGIIKENEKDGFREALGKKIATEMRENEDAIFKKWVKETKQQQIAKVKNKWHFLENKE
jgi:Initiator Replication protein